MGDHTESVQVHYDPAKCSYEQLLTVFWSEHHPSGSQGSRQYRSAIFTHTPAQATAASAAKAALSYKATTAIEPYKFWTDAEEYHQNYLQKHS